MLQPKGEICIEIRTFRKQPVSGFFQLLLGHCIDLGVAFREESWHVGAMSCPKLRQPLDER